MALSNDRFVSYAQNLEDVMLWRALSAAAGGSGFYIDVGAADPTALSVTRAFYDRGWTGINVEPLPEQAERLREARPRDITVEAAIAAGGGAATQLHRVTKDGQTGLSTTDAAEAEHHRTEGAAVDVIQVPATSLAAVCREHVRGPIHFLKIDVEGAEAAAIGGADFTAFRPWIVLVEATQPLHAAASDLQWEPGLLEAGYDHVWFDGLNRFYLAREHAELARHFRVPPNVFDGYSVYDAPLNEHLAETAALCQRRGEMIERLQAELADARRRPRGGLAAAPAPSSEAAPAPVPVPAVQASISLPFTGSGVGRRIGMRLYRLVRPVARPLAWRSRQFMTGDLREEMAGLRERLDQLVARPVARVHAEPANADAMERLLLTLALQDARDPAPPGLDPPPRAACGLPKADSAR